MSDPTMERCRFEGRVAARLGMTAEDNPYTSSFESGVWKMGWGEERARRSSPSSPWDVYNVARELNADLSAISWSGFNLFGDRASIAEVTRLMHEEARFIAYRERKGE